MAITPMMQQYLQIKETVPDTLLLFRLGDFYELFFDDAELVSRELELTLTGKDCGMSERAPMCGVPYHAVDTYVAKLVEKGYKVAICEQLTDPAESKGLVERAITRIITPGTVIENNMLDERATNYIMALCMVKKSAGMAFCDLSTGEFFVHQFNNAPARLKDELTRIMPREVLVAEETDQLHSLADMYHFTLTRIAPETITYANASKCIIKHFKVPSITSLGLNEARLGVCAAGALMQYLTETQKNSLEHISHIQRYQADQHMALDMIARQSLEITQSLHGHGRKGSLLWLLDKTITTMGSRLLRSWIEQPLFKREAIEERLDAVSWFVDHPFERTSLQEALKPVRDVERLLSRIAYDTINARDCLMLLSSLKAIPALSNGIMQTSLSLIAQIRQQLDPMTELVDLLERAIDPDASMSVKEGGIIRNGYSVELDELREASTSGKRWLSELEAQEREKTGIKNLKIGFNRIFGFYLEVTRSYYELVPTRYIRKQTLASCERFVTDELKELEKKILGAEESSMRLEYQIFTQIRAHLNGELERLSRVAQGIKCMDALIALAQAAVDYGYVRPEINEEGIYQIQNGRHPVVEQSIGQDKFVPNDTTLNKEERVMIITGPNMAGKSTYMRQVALIVLMTHVGSFVPAEHANIAITDRIFTRIGASDDLFGGQSTFMVEMEELSNILKFATPHSLLILDEIGRGTSTFDGLSIAWAAVEHIANTEKCGACAMFATHYHELSELEGRLDGIVNYRITAMERGSEVIFLRKVVKGGADHSYGVAVAALAGLPNSLITRARQIMARLEVRDEAEGSIGQSILDQSKNGGNRQLSLTDYQPMELVEEIRQIDVMSLSPIDALNTLFKLSEKARRI